jgi:exopolysaccharide biosynthesis polyprenyl glycosylphosphotransferase
LTQAAVAGRNLRRHWVRDCARVTGLVVADVAVFVMARGVVRWVRDAAGLGEAPARVLQWLWPLGTLSGLRFLVALLLSLLVVGAYGSGDRRRDPGRMLAASALAGALVFYPLAWTEHVWTVVLRWATLAGAFATALALSRSVVDWLAGKVAPRLVPIRTVLVTHGSGDWVGVPELVAQSKAGRSRIQPVGTVVAGGGRSDGALPLGELGRLIAERGADTVLVTGPLSDGDFGFVVDVARAHGCQVLAASRTVRVAGVEPRATWVSGRPLVELETATLSPVQQAIKRAMDVAGALLGLLLLAPLMVLIAVAVRLESPGPVFFVSERWGRHGKRIRILKFRTMRVGAEVLLAGDRHMKERFSANIKLKDDPRVTTLGRLLRRMSLDELPQLINVLFGDMSLVGPRPKLIGEEERYGQAFGAVLSVRPGMTGLWQISGRNDTSYEQRITLDISYVRNWSVWLDIRILWRTFGVVLTGRGAY